MNKITKKLLNLNKNSEFLIDLYAQELVFHLVQQKASNQILCLENQNPVNIAIRFMKENYMHSISIQQLAFDLNMSESNFCQYFKKITGCTPVQYFINFKMEKAIEMLKKESVTDVAFDLGYDNISYFILIFKKMYGMTPKQYQIYKTNKRN